MPNNQDLKEYIKKENNLIKFDFKKYKYNKLLEFGLKKQIFLSKNTPLEIYKKFQQMEELKNQLSFNEFINYLKDNQIWDSKQSLEIRIKFYLRKKYGYLKLFELLKKDLYNEEDIQNYLNSIPAEVWNHQILEIIRSIKKNYPNLDKKQLQKKIYNKLLYLGYRENEIQNIKENSIDNS